jgi:hypothetical protein
MLCGRYTLCQICSKEERIPINGSLNLMRKYLKCNCDEIISSADEGFVVNPVKVKF